MATGEFKNYVLSGRFNQVAGQAVADAIAKTKAFGLPVEGYANTDPHIPQRRVPARHAHEKIAKRAA